MPSNEPRDSDQRLARYGCLILFLVFIVVGLATIRDYGISWDEEVQATYGELVFEHFRSGFQDQRCNHYRDLYLYGPLFEALSAAIYSRVSAAKFEIRHVLVWACSLLTVVAVFRIGGLFRLPLTALFAPLCLLVLPRFYGDAFSNSKDIPFACAFAWAMLSIFRLLLSDGRAWRDFLLCGAWIGIALATRVGGLLLFLYLAAGAVLARILVGFGRGQAGTGLAWKRLVPRVIVLVALAGLILIASWPWLWQSPVSHFREALESAQKFATEYPVVFEGRVFSSAGLPRHYVPKYLWITTPPALLFLFLAGLAAMLAGIVRQARSRESLLGSVTLIWFFLPIATMAIKRPSVYDGIRHFLFLLPALAVICGYGAAWVRDLLRVLLPRAAAALVLLLCLVPLKDLVSLHPYQYTYFNLFSGGLSKAWRGYDTDYWVRSYKEAAEWVNERAREAPDRRLTVVLAANDYCRICAAHYLEPNVEVHTIYTGDERLPERFDYYVATHRYGFDRMFSELPVVHVIGRQGAVFTVIKRGKEQVPPAP